MARAALHAVGAATLLLCISLTRPDGAANASVQEPTSQDARSFYAAAMAAYERRDHAEYLRNLKKAANLRPSHPIVLQKLAGAYALNGDATAAAAALRMLAALRVYFDVAADRAFAGVMSDPAVRKAVEAVNHVRELHIGDARAAWTIPDASFIPEGIAFDPETRSFYVSSQYRRKVVRIDEQGTISDFIPEGQDGIWMVFGIAVDPGRGWLWAVSTSDPVMRRFTTADENRAGLFAFDLATGKLKMKITVGPEPPRRYFDDVAVSPDGSVFVSDGGAGAVRVLKPGAGELTTLVAPGTIQGPNGLAVVPPGRMLFVADYAGFIFRIDTVTGEARRLEQRRDTAMYGIDGLSWHDGSLIAVQNGVTPARVLNLRLSEDGTAIREAEILAMNHPALDEPTLGVVVDHAFYWVANSHGGVLRRPNVKIEEEQLTPPAILQLSLAPPRP